MSRSTALSITVCAALLAATATATAGDPCPIGFDFYDVGAPDWLDRDELLGALASKDSWIGLSFKSSKDGILVTNVSDGSPAGKAGLANGDVITALDGTAYTDHKAAGLFFRGKKPGDTIKVDLKRADRVETLTLKLGAQDPLVGALIDHAAAQECSDVSRANMTPEQTAEIRTKLFSKTRRFECKKAHRRLAKLDYLDEAAIVVVRGSKRVLISKVGWATTCVSAADFDGDKLTDKAVGKVFKRLTKAYVDDRHRNP
jgi:hypothetical protein